MRKIKLPKRKRLLIVGSLLCMLAIPTAVIAARHSEPPKENTALSKQGEAKPVEVATEPVATPTPTETPTPANTTTPQPAKITPTAPATTPAPAEAKNPYQEGFGYWYVFNRRTAVGKPVGTTWVNPQQWLYYAKQDGYTIDKNPEKWAISATTSGNILAFVESVNDDGSLTMSAMNYTSGWNKTDTFQVSQAELAAWNFIH